MTAVLDFLDSVWARIKARWRMRAAAELPQGAELVRQAERDKAELDKLLSSEPTVPPPPKVIVDLDTTTEPK